MPRNAPVPSPSFCNSPLDKDAPVPRSVHPADRGPDRPSPAPRRVESHGWIDGRRVQMPVRDIASGRDRQARLAVAARRPHRLAGVPGAGGASDCLMFGVRDAHIRVVAATARRSPGGSLTGVDLDSILVKNGSMKTTIDIPEDELKDAMRFTKAVVKVLEEFNRRRRMAELVKYSGSFSDGFPTNEEIEAIDATQSRKLNGRPRR